QAEPNTASATNPAASASRRSAGRDQRSCVVLNRNRGLGGYGLALDRQNDQRDEGEEPGQVEVEPVRQHELEADQQGGGQRGELPRRLPPRHEVDGDRANHEQHLEHALDEMQVRVTSPVLPPVPDRERRVPADLELDRPIVEDVRSVERARLQQQDRESARGRKQEAAQENELLARPSQSVRVRG